MLEYTAKYFTKTRKIINKFKRNAIVTMQFFQRHDNVMLCGINEVLALLQTQTKTHKYTLKSLKEGTIVNQGDVVLELEGPYSAFGEYEGVIDGILARASSLATNAYRIKQLTTKALVFMGDRADHYINQEWDGYAVRVGGINLQVTDAQVKFHGGLAIGTMPHVLIQMFEGDLIQALEAYHKTFPQEKLSALVDFNNDVIGDALKALHKFKENLTSVRVDTSPNISDQVFAHARTKEFGVTPNLIKKLRTALDQNEGKHVKIIVSSGFDAQKIAAFEKAQAPVDIYGLGASLLKVWINFSADAVKLNGRKIAKAGRSYREFEGLKRW